MDNAERYRKEQDPIFQDLEEREMIRKQASELEEAKHERLVESLTDILMKYRRSNGRAITTEQARNRVIKVLALED
jgi:hypothetical protein